MTTGYDEEPKGASVIVAFDSHGAISFDGSDLQFSLDFFFSS